MRKFTVSTPLRGLRRADGVKEPIGVGEVVSLPDTVTPSLLMAGAIAPTQADVTCDLIWEAQLGGGAGVPDADIASVSARGGIVFFPGEGLPDNAELALGDFSNEQLLDELALRIGEGRLSPVVMGAEGTMLELGDTEGGDDAQPNKSAVLASDDGAAVEAALGTSVSTDPPVIAAKPARKPKAEQK